MRELVRLARLLGPHRRRLVLGIGLALATVLANIGLLALSSWFIASMAIAGSLGAAMDYTLPAAGVRALAIVRALGRYAERLVNHDTTFRVLGSIRLWFYRRIEPLAPARLAGFRSGDLLARIRADIDTLDDYYVRGVVPAIVALLAGACILPFLSRYDPALAWIDGLGLVAAGLAAPLALACLAARPGRESVARSAELRASIVEEIEGMAELVVLGAAAPRARLMDEVSMRLDSSQRKLNSLQGIGEASIVAASSLSVAGAALVLISLVGSGALPPADMAMLTVFILASFETILPLPTAIQKSGEMAAAARRLFELLDAEPAVADGSGGAAAAPPISATLSVRDLYFRYTQVAQRPLQSTSSQSTPAGRYTQVAQRPLQSTSSQSTPELPFVFDGLSFELPAGSRLGLAGPSGAGKSSLVNLLLRFWDYQGGTIELNGRDLRSFGLDEARRYFSVLPQAPFLYHASIRENLLVAARPEGGEPDPADEERLLEALEAAQALGTPVQAARRPRFDRRRDGQGAVGRRAAAHGPRESLPQKGADLSPRRADRGPRRRDRRCAARDDCRSSKGASILIISHRERDLEIADRVCVSA